METRIQPINNAPAFLPVMADVQPAFQVIPVQQPKVLPFIEANTKEATLSHLTEDCIIPVFSKDNEVTISHQSFIQTIQQAAHDVFPNEQISNPVIRVSHIVKGRIPEAIHKPVSQLLETDKTIYYERMMFCFEIPSIHQDIDGCRLNLTIGGVRAYNEQNLYSKKAPEKFRIFIGFKNMVCCNLCVSTDGYKSCLRVMDTAAMLGQAIDLFRGYDMQQHLQLMEAYRECSMSESQFAQFLGKCRMYQYLPSSQKKHLPNLLMTDTQVGIVARSYYEDPDFGGSMEGEMYVESRHVSQQVLVHRQLPRQGGECRASHNGTVHGTLRGSAVFLVHPVINNKKSPRYLTTVGGSSIVKP